ncbi:MAG TPA: CocE/NonD family hydrolase [Steroidobacter sp.]|uniref:CocE/NonD family hydrolase n=1 Tax=Steroidobacter sp. TaxID=1978227 RepID=UPI002EDA4BF3
MIPTLRKSEILEGMRIDWDMEIPLSDGSLLRADVFRPIDDGKYPVLMTHGPYAKGLHFEDGFPGPWANLLRDHPEIARGSTNRFANWETPDPERWIPHGYVCVRVDSRGAGCSPGVIDFFSPRETQDFYECIEWAGVQPWSNGKVGLLGISYYAANQWQVAALRPPHLAAIAPFEGFTDYYRDLVRHGGMLSTFMIRWYPNQVLNVQYGLGTNGRVSRYAGTPIAGPETLDEETLAANRIDIKATLLEHPLIDDYFAERTPDLSKIEVPLLSWGNWGGMGVHLRGNIEGFVRSGSKQKWLEMHGLEHWTEFYTDYGLALQKRFFDHFLKGVDNGWDEQPPLLLQIRHVDGFKQRNEDQWPLARTQWVRHYLDADRLSISADRTAVSGAREFRAMKEELSFSTAPFAEQTEITGPVAAKLFISSSTTDADLLLTLRLFDPQDKEVLFVGAVDPNVPLTQGWLRASHRKLDASRSLPWRPFHSHDEVQPLVPGDIYELDIEIWPTCIVVPKGYRLKLTVSGHDFDHGLPEPMPQIYGVSQRGSSVMLHDEPLDRPAEIYGGTTTIYTGAEHSSYLLLPIIDGR